MQGIRRTAISLGFAGLGLLALAAAPAGAAGPFDGTYTGPQTTTLTNNTANCQNMDRDVSITVRDSKIVKIWGPRRDTVEAEVKADGTFFGSTSATVVGQGRTREYILRGKISGGKLEGEIGSSQCGVKMSLTKKS
jgi:hypothetical protein